ncbi:beta-D-xylosidase 1 [Elysia marginata]|uniref:Beta-D-xylosidase 1 n=1 Tax=Elysia marginata TaxID=1093978 RepID=A0AAV4HGJ4_9GAST|nr:beta-D-xylosidase 1 [Elysia marginata]
MISAISLVRCFKFHELSEKQHINFEKNFAVSENGISASASLHWGNGDSPKEDDYPFRDPSLPWDVRVDDLVSRLTLQEIMVQMARGGAGEYTTPAPAIPRLGVPPYVFNSNCHRGDQGAKGDATAFPQSIGIAATFSPQALFDVATVASIETRGKHNDFVKAGSFATHTGASCFSPMINIVRDPRWGRIQETYGEDPYMSGELAAIFLKGLHGDNDRFVRVTGICETYAVYSGPEDIPSHRESFDAKVTDEDLYMTYLPGMKRCVEAGSYSVMCSYNSINDVPACVNKRTMTDILRTAWKFKGYVVSDQGAIEYVISQHKYLHTHVDVAAAAVNAGCNLELSNNDPYNVFMSIVDAVEQGKLDESLVRQRVKPLFYTRMRLGQFDPPETNPYSKLNSSVVYKPEHKQKALDVATKSFVLLKNENDALPLDPSKFKKVTLIGPMADNYKQMFGNLPPEQSRNFAKTPLQSLKEIFPGLHYKPVCHDQTKCTSLDKDLVEKLSKDKELIIAALGTGPDVESEHYDRENLELPGYQKEILLDIIQYSECVDLHTLSTLKTIDH